MDPIAQLRSSGQELAPGLATALATTEPSLLVPGLRAVLGDPLLRDDPVQGWAPVHAARWLGRLGATSAAVDLAEVLGECDPEDHLHEACTQALVRLGHAGVIAVIAAVAAGTLEAMWAAPVLGACGAQGPAIRRVWAAALEQAPFIAAEAIAEAGDTTARDLVEAALARADDVERPLIAAALARLS